MSTYHWLRWDFYGETSESYWSNYKHHKPFLCCHQVGEAAFLTKKWLQNQDSLKCCSQRMIFCLMGDFWWQKTRNSSLLFKLTHQEDDQMWENTWKSHRSTEELQNVHMCNFTSSGLWGVNKSLPKCGAEKMDPLKRQLIIHNVKEKQNADRMNSDTVGEEPACFHR